ncbi:MAG: YggT family protein [Rhodoferax sp.]|uniref:YggT family protein n=1 Tax=Rhodoferax sp. TaxID=50421 RepID=UPI002ACF037D|nr:YggT family protein [Rhodoferax sp.]MDZ7891638.1 YggT family protein [Rhodoferax sp.]
MLYKIVVLLLEVVTGLLTTICLLRLYMQQQRIPLSARSGNPLGRFVFALTDWIVLPLRRVVPALGPWDMASLVAAFLIQLAHFGALWALNGFGVTPMSIVVLALLGLVRLSLSGLTALVLVYAVLSWVQAQSFFSELIGRLVTPVLAPIRKVVPLVGGVDLSPLVLLVLLQILTIVLGDLQYTLLSAVAG